MHFDKIIMNPPYKGTLHLQILTMCLKFISEGGKVVNLSPAAWLIDPMAEYKKDCVYKKFAYLEKYIYSLKVYSRGQSRDLFGANIDLLSLYELRPEGQSNFRVDRSLARQVMDRTEVTYKDLMKHDKTEYWVPVAKFRWTSDLNQDYQPFSLALKEDGNFAKTGWTKYLHDCYEIFYFDSYEELVNFKAFLNLPSYRSLLGQMFPSRRLPIYLIPMMPTYKHPWTDDDVCAYFGIYNLTAHIK